MCSLLLEFLTEFPFPNTILHDVQIYWLGVDPTCSFLPINSSSLRSDKIITVLFISFLLLQVEISPTVQYQHHFSQDHGLVSWMRLQLYVTNKLGLLILSLPGEVLTSNWVL